MDFHRLLQFAVEHDASDVHMQAGLRPNLRIGGILRSVDVPIVTDEAYAYNEDVEESAEEDREAMFGTGAAQREEKDNDEHMTSPDPTQGTRS